MQSFHSRKHCPVGPVNASIHPTQKQRLQRNADHSYRAAFSAAQYSSVAAPMTPPPQYSELYNDGFQQPQYSMPQHAQPYSSRPNVGHVGPIAPYGQPQPSVWASTSTIDVARPQIAGEWAQEHTWQSNTPLATRPMNVARNDCPIARGMNQGAALCDRMATRLNDMLCRANGQTYGQSGLDDTAGVRELEDTEGIASLVTNPSPVQPKPATDKFEARGGIINFKKTWLYQNSRLPPGMMPLNIYMPTWTLVCRAAQASVDAYNRPPRGQREYYTDADPSTGTKAMIIKTQPVDDRKLIIVAIRGSQWNMIDWAVNFRPAPTEPVGFLDDAGNACHAGFLQVARAMVGQIAAQLRRLIEEDPSWVTSSLMFTGHSAGGAVASLLYAHMLARTVESDLTNLVGIFRRIHCITFGVPPLSLLPLQTPSDRRHDKNQFLSFANEGDLVVRADRRYVHSLLKLYAAPAPSSRPVLRERMSRQRLRGHDASAVPSSRAPTWSVPDATLSNAGRMVLLREKPANRKRIEAVQVTDGELRGVVFGDAAMHAMALYKNRIDELAFAAVSGRDAG